jgi:hypothetical protein
MRRGGWHWGDWGKNIDKEALQQCWYGVALRGFAEMAKVTGHKSDAMMAEQMYDKMLHTFNEKYWNEELQHYKSAKYKDLPDDRVQAMAVIAGFVPESRYEIIRKFLSTHYNASPYMEKYVLESLCKMGYYDDALKRMELRFGEMVRAKYSTLWEGWEYTGARGKSGTSDASAEFVASVRNMLDNADIIWQSGELGRVDLGGGGTVAQFIANMGVDVVDLGVPVLSMHAPFETTAKFDVYMCYKAMYEFMK